MIDLDELLEVAKSADPGTRIELRDSIAAHGGRAIPAMRMWLEIPRLGAFAARVLGRIAEDTAHRVAVLNAFASVDAGQLSESVAGDVSETVSRIRGVSQLGAARTGRPHRPRNDQWPGTRSVSRLEMQFHDAMLDIFTLAGEATRKRRPDGSTIRGYWASYFLRGVRNHGGPEYAHQLLLAQGTSDGFQRLTDEHRLDLTVEALVLRPEFVDLFTASERSIAAHRLARAVISRPEMAEPSQSLSAVGRAHPTHARSSSETLTRVEQPDTMSASCR
jgi:hypothetical protein